MKSKKDTSELNNKILAFKLDLLQAYNKLRCCTYAPSIYDETQAEINRLKIKISKLEKCVHRKNKISEKTKKKKPKNPSVARTLRIFGAHPPKHRQVNMGSCGRSSYDGCSSSSIHAISTPMGNKR